MPKKWSLILAFMLPGITVLSQVNPKDTSRAPITDIPVLDTTLNYEELFQDFDEFMDSILTPRSYLLASISTTNGYYSFEQKTNEAILTQKKLTYSPTLGYYD